MALSNKYNAADSEKKWQQFWDQEGIYAFDEQSDKETFSIDTPPPTVSGKLHIGHVFSYTQAEIVARYQRMLGKNVMYPFGFDDNGLPTEILTEREKGIKGSQMPRSEFVKNCEEVYVTMKVGIITFSMLNISLSKKLNRKLLQLYMKFYILIT